MDKIGLPRLQAGDCVEIIAPASRCTEERLTSIISLLKGWGIQTLVSQALFGDDLLCAHRDEQRFLSFISAMQNPKTQAVICARGGYGSMRLIPYLLKTTPPKKPKLLIGMSDITALHLYIQQHWHWPTLHGGLHPNYFSHLSHTSIQSILFKEVVSIEFWLTPLNHRAKEPVTLTSAMTGGNLTLIQSSLGTAWQIEAKEKIVFIEEVGERAYRIDRMLEQLLQANIFNQASAIVFGDFIEGNEENGESLVQSVLQRFANQIAIPVLQLDGVGHSHINFPLPLGTPAHLELGAQSRLRCEI